MTPTRRTILKSAAWSVPVIAAAVAVPLASASTIPEAAPQPIACERLNRQGQPTYLVAYDDNTREVMHQGQIDRDKTLQALCRGKGPEA